MEVIKIVFDLNSNDYTTELVSDIVLNESSLYSTNGWDYFYFGLENNRKLVVTVNPNKVKNLSTLNEYVYNTVNLEVREYLINKLI